ncbi:MAG: SBBP repeat-containing protein [Euryarchaeota archaeon]|nr:SBBP repeat-containing protein [Euryarchaeota archaeon]
MKNRNLNKALEIGIVALFVLSNFATCIGGQTISLNISDQNAVQSVGKSCQIEDKTISDTVKKSDSPRVLDTLPSQSEMIYDQFASSSLFFTANKGQFPDEVLFQTHALGATVYLCKDKVVSVFTREIEGSSSSENNIQQDEPIHMRDEPKSSPKEMISVVAQFVDASNQACIVGEGLLSHYNNYFIGNDPHKWYTDVPNYQSVVYQNIYPGIDLRYYPQGNTLKYDFIVNPGADPSQITIRYDGLHDFQLTSSGNIVASTRLGTTQEQKPLIYQVNNDMKQDIQGRYELRKAPQSFGFACNERYDRSRALVIDPALEYSTFLGGMMNDMGLDIEVDQNDCVYVTGATRSCDFPMMNPYDGIYNGGDDAFVTKFSAHGNELVYSTYLGGTDDDGACSIAVDQNGCAYVTGITYSNDFPMVNPFDMSTSGLDEAFVSKLSAQGNELVYSTYLGGTQEDEAFGIVVDQNNNAYITGSTSSDDFPTTVDSYDGSLNGDWDVFVVKFSPQGNTLIYSTYIGGTGSELSLGIAINQLNCVYVTGWTKSNDFPTVNPYDKTFNGGADVFISKFSPQGNQLVYSTYLGGTGWDQAWDIAVDQNNCAYVTGDTWSNDFPMANPYDGTYCCVYGDAFVSKLSAQGNELVYSTYLGGTYNDNACCIKVDQNNCAYIAGTTQSPDFPILNPYDGDLDTGYGSDGFITKFSAQGNQLSFSTYIGGEEYERINGIVVDQNNCVYICGITSSPDFPTTPGAYDTTFAGYSPYIYDVFVTKIQFGPQNEPPVAVDDYVSVATDSVNNKISVLSNDYDPEGDPITIVLVTQPSHGVVYMVGGPALPWSHMLSSGYFLYYTPTHTSPTGTWSGHGTDSFTYTINDLPIPGHNVTATVYINVIHPTPGTDPTDLIPV